MRTLSLSKVYQLLEPGPVVLLTTAHRGRANVMAMSWHMMIEFEPPQLACVVSNANYSFAALRATGRMRDRHTGAKAGDYCGEGRKFVGAEGN